MVIDGGSSADEGRGEVGRAIIVPYLQSMGVNRVDVLVITHADADHCNGLASVVSEVPVGLALDGSLSEPSPVASHHDSNGGKPTDTSPAHAQVQAALRVRGVPVYPARPGQTIRLGDGITLTDLAPTQPPLHGEA